MKKIIARLSTTSLLAFAAIAVASSCSSVSPDGKEWVASTGSAEPVAASSQAITGTQKTCNFTTVPDTWNANLCRNWSTSFNGIGGTYRLGCLFTTFYSVGNPVSNSNPTPSLPGTNCGW